MNMTNNLLNSKKLRLVALMNVLLGAIASIHAAEPNPLFIRSCAGCHGADGRADTKMGKFLQVKDLTQSKLSEAEIEQAIRNGISSPDGRRRMPAFAESLSAEEVKALVAEVKVLQR
jgi:mono/diheme cytochrome c family protein